MRLVSRSVLLSLALLAFVQAGCLALVATTAVGGGAAAYAVAKAKVTRVFDAPLDATAVATESALRDLNMPIDKRSIGVNYGEMDSSLAGGEPVLIDFKIETPAKPDDPPRTKVGIHIKVFGDKQLSQRILDQVSHRLKNPAPVVPPSTATSQTTLPPPPPLPDPQQTAEPGLAPTK